MQYSFFYNRSLNSTSFNKYCYNIKKKEIYINFKKLINNINNNIIIL